ncbi:hypothetical protein BJ322DRAFT_450249 [Thelephora terrestris]|uniref:Uncharacterized protein n=1 Tax=Thelephora terrestris TaxID=56493 RepID=A0A9P6L226_9AGAM|nr:hypothetical protein BJ322DRAFT_450249 [Thelephora terrestris]
MSRSQEVGSVEIPHWTPPAGHTASHEKKTYILGRGWCQRPHSTSGHSCHAQRLFPPISNLKSLAMVSSPNSRDCPILSAGKFTVSNRSSYATSRFESVVSRLKSAPPPATNPLSDFGTPPALSGPIVRDTCGSLFQLLRSAVPRLSHSLSQTTPTTVATSLLSRTPVMMARYLPSWMPTTITRSLPLSTPTIATTAIPPSSFPNLTDLYYSPHYSSPAGFQAVPCTSASLCVYVRTYLLLTDLAIPCFYFLPCFLQTTKINWDFIMAGFDLWIMNISI